MTDHTEEKERRRHKRYQVREQALAINSFAIGQITDISFGGLSFKYISKESGKKELTELDIFLSDNDFYLEGIPIEPVSDRATPNASPFSTIVIRRCGIKFGKLSPNQLSKLEYFIQHYTTGEA